MGPEGGQVKTGAASVTIPKGALAIPVEISISAVTTGYPAVAFGMVPRGEVFAFLPHAQAFSIPVTIQVPFASPAEPSNLKLFTAQPGGSWSQVSESSVAGQGLQAEVDHFSFYLPGEGEPVATAGACQAPPKDDGSYLCVHQYYRPEEAKALAAGVMSTCTDGKGTYLDACPAGANPGCCTHGPSSGSMQVICYYNCTADFCGDLQNTCTSSNGRWGTSYP